MRISTTFVMISAAAALVACGKSNNGADTSNMAGTPVDSAGAVGGAATGTTGVTGTTAADSARMRDSARDSAAMGGTTTTTTTTTTSTRPRP